MNTKTIEEKAKAYDKVREKIAIRFGSNVADEIFSQFEMSEDERIRKELIEFVKSRGGFKQEYIAWLEKQGKYKQVEVRPFNTVFSQEQIDEIDKRIEKEIKLYNAKLMDAQMRAKDFPMTD